MTTRSPALAYSGRTTNWTFVWITAALTVPLIVLSVQSRGEIASPEFWIPATLAALAVVMNILTAATLVLVVGAHGVSARYGVFGWPRFHYRTEKIASYEATDVPFLAGAGWGIWWTPNGGLRLLVAHGPALRLKLTNGRTVTISTPHPDDAAHALRVIDGA